MFIYNIKLGGSKLFKFMFIFIFAFVVGLCAFIGYKIFTSSINVNDNIYQDEFNELTNKNYSTILKAIHDDVDSYIGTKIKFSGFVYRVYDLDTEQFVLGRNMIISSDFQTVVIGFLCHYNNAINLKDNTWVEVEGTITKGEYHGDMPILEVTSLKQIEKPNDEYVYPPDENYIPTSTIL